MERSLEEDFFGDPPSAVGRTFIDNVPPPHDQPEIIDNHLNYYNMVDESYGDPLDSYGDAHDLEPSPSTLPEEEHVPPEASLEGSWAEKLLEKAEELQEDDEWAEHLLGQVEDLAFQERVEELYPEKNGDEQALENVDPEVLDQLSATQEEYMRLRAEYEQLMTQASARDFVEVRWLLFPPFLCISSE